MTITYPFPLLEKEINLIVNPAKTELLAVADLCPEDNERLQSLVSGVKKEELLWSRTALSKALSSTDLKQLYYRNKKPFIAKGNVSLSHCSNGVAAAYSANLEVGIDIETKRNQVLVIAHKFTTKEETALISTNEIDALQCLWGIKESLFKLYGHGDVDFKKHLTITSFHWDEKKSNGWGTAWISSTCKERPLPLQCLVQAAIVNGQYIALASHREPLKPLQSERLELREWKASDALWLYELNSNPKVIQFTGDTGFSSPLEALRLIQTYPNYQRDGFGRWIVVHKKDDRPIGWCGLKNNPWGIDLGFRFFSEYWGNGIATEAAFSTLKWAKAEGLSRIIGRTLSENKASIRVLEKVNMVLTQKLPVNDLYKDSILDPQHRISWEGQTLNIYALKL
jgi:[ribosomal protein S5]-alanine N-acetyltransferase